MPLLDVIIGLSSLITLVYGGYLALVGEITLGRFVAFNQYINMLVWPMLACGDAINMFSQGSASTRRIREIFDEKPEIYDRKDVQPPDEIRGGYHLFPPDLYPPRAQRAHSEGYQSGDPCRHHPCHYRPHR